MAEPTAQQKSIVLSFLDFVSKSAVMDAEQLEVTQSMLKDAFKLGDEAATVDLVSIWPAEAASEEPEFDEKKWQEFREVLNGKGYFKGCDEGSDEYKQREEKARQKFIARSNPYEGLSAEQLKAQGNELMMKGQHKAAIGYYSKAIELDPSNAVYYCNRAAAHTHLSQYQEAVKDCEKSTQLRPDYSKAYSRLGTAYFYRQDFVAAVEAFKKACDLEPANETYKQDLASAEEKLSQAPAMPGMPPGMGGMPGFDMNSIGQMMSNPQFQDMAKSVMTNPAFGDMVQNMAKNMGMDSGAMPDPAKMAEMWGAPGGARNMPTVSTDDGEEMLHTPFGPLSKAKLEKLHEDQDIKNNPKFQALSEDLKREGPMAIMKHMNDPEVMNAIGNFSKLFQEGGAGAGGSEPSEQ